MKHESALEALADLPGLIRSLDIANADDAGLRKVLTHIRTAQRSLDGLVMRIGTRADQLHKAGQSGSAEETMGGAGTVGGRTARRDARRARTTDAIEGLGDAVSAGAVSGEHVDSIARHITKLTEKQRATVNLKDLVEQAQAMSPDSFDRFMKRRVEEAQRDHGLGDAESTRAASEFRHWFDHKTGLGRFSGALDPERYETLTDAIDQHMASIAATAEEPVAKTRNLAAAALVELTLSAGGRDGRNRLPSVTVIVDHKTVVDGVHERSVRQTAAGHDVPPEAVSRLCCDAVIRRVTLDERGVPINVGRKYRTATDAQWSAVKAVHASCAWAGCDAPIQWCQAHHVREWEHGGPTDLDNLVPLCSRHHHRVHEGRWQIKLLPDRTLQIFLPNGVVHATVPTPQRC